MCQSLHMYTNTHTHTHTHTHLLSIIEPRVNSVTSSFHSKWAFQEQMVEICGCLCVCPCLSCVSLRPSSKIKFFFGFWEPVDWAGAGLRLLTGIYATFNLITMWSSGLFGLLTSWASYSEPLFLCPMTQKGNIWAQSNDNHDSQNVLRLYET